jgi:tRNA threonylcarbamoyladenosine biosynthesis protein TsaB
MDLFIDTTFGITVGLLDSRYKWIDYQFIEGKKGSALIHKIIYDLLEKNKSSTSEISKIFQVSGPGSYTGMRVSEGIANIFDWQNVKINSFYHFDIPALLGVEEGKWITDAFKGETFIYSWDKTGEDRKLVKNNAIEVSLDIPVFTLRNKEGESLTETQGLIKDRSEDLFSAVNKKDLKRDLYYFRTIEMEFTKANKQ